MIGRHKLSRTRRAVFELVGQEMAAVRKAKELQDPEKAHLVHLVGDEVVELNGHIYPRSVASRLP